MNVRWRRRGWIAFGALWAVLFAAGAVKILHDHTDRYSVAFEVTGAASTASIYLQAAQVPRTVGLPYEYDTTVGGGSVLFVSASKADRDVLTCQITVDGRVVVRHTGRLVQCLAST